MAHRKRRPGGKRNERRPDTDTPRPTAADSRPPPPDRPLPPPRPPRKNLPLLVTTIILFAGWLVFLTVLAVNRFW